MATKQIKIIVVDDESVVRDGVVAILSFQEDMKVVGEGGDGVKAVDDYTVTLSLTAPKLDVPESLFHYPAQIMHRSFNGDLTTLSNPGTGPMKLDEFKVGERVKVSRREGYWQNGEDGQPLPYLRRQTSETGSSRRDGYGQQHF